MSQIWADTGAAQDAAGRRAGRAMRRMVLVLAVLIGALGAGGQAAAQAPRPAAAPLPSAREAQNALAVLKDDKRRAQLISTLETIAKAAPVADAVAADPGAADAPADPAATATPAAAGSAAAPAAKPSAIAPDSVGVQLVGRLSVMLSAYAQQFATSLRSVNDLPLLWSWITSQAVNPVARAAVIEAFGKLLVVLGGALLVEYLVRRLLGRIRAAVLAWAPHRAEVADPAAKPAMELRRHRLEGLIAGLRQVPYLVGRLVLDLLPLAAFAAVADLMLGTALGDPIEARLVSVQAVQAYLLARMILAGCAFLVSPAKPRLRLLGVTDWAAAFLTRWARLVVAIVVTGFAVADIGALFGMDPTARLALLKLFGLAAHLCLIAAVLQAREPVAHRLHARRTMQGVWATLLNRFAERWHLLAILLIMGLWLVWAVQVQNGYQRLLTFFAMTAAVLLAARLLAVLLLGGLERGRAWLDPKGAGRVGVYYPIVRGLISAMIWFFTGIGLLEVWGVPILLWVTVGGLGTKVLDAVFTIVVTILLAVAAWEAVNTGIARHMSNLSSTSQLARAGRVRTLLPLLRTTMMIALVLIVGMIVLSAIGVNIAPLLAGAGVLGIAIGFGSQKLVQDLITGLFLLLENSMQVGDVVTVGGLTGTVEALSIRTIRLRATDGSVHLIPFSAVTTVTNQTRDYGYAVLDVSIGLNEEPGPVEQILRDLAAEMQADAAWQSIILADLDVMGVEKLTDLAWILRVRIKTQPSSRWAVSRELNRRIKLKFDELAIESPFTSHRALSREAPVPQVSAEAEEAAA